MRHRLRVPNAVVDRSGGPAIYSCSIRHTRTTPLRNHFQYRSYLWFVDLDDLPRAPRPLADFRASDHLGSGPQIRANLDDYLATQGIDLDGGRVRLLTAARVLGYVFNPLSVYWCHDRSGELVCVVAEVHNTYGGRHCYLIRTDEHGRGQVEKDFYVSPFEPSSGGHYTMSLPEPGEDLDLTVTLHRPGQAPFVTGVKGRRHPATRRVIARFALRFPLAPLAVTARIRFQGIKLWARGLRIVPRPAHVRQEAVE
ncbi:DUF1365 domain-containing protein [Kineosporia babensis]|uniref:DUF1365 domain-containing protein n=1 Tax=Kineosporia babensis TaxID=499548 RepID=A0A9X1NGJ4_9ACTN|nr:DUF1365 domain-containing protein [Kineosporia babensis]